ncbi:hypothetical protein JCM11641_003871 [Rhodosporidiobolus odoratus]
MDFYHRAGLILDSLDAKKGSVKGLCMAEAKKGKRQGEGARFLKVVVEVLKYRPHIDHLLTATKLLAQEPTLFIPPSSTAALTSAVKSGSAAAASKALAKAPRKRQEKVPPTPTSLASVMLHDLMFAKRGLTLPKEHKVRKKLEKYKPALEKENEREKRRRKVATNEGLQIPLPEKVASSLEGIGKGKKRAHDAERFLGEEGGEDLTGDVRWLRVNTLRWTVEAAVEWLEKGGWTMHEEVGEMLAAAQATPKVFALDAHIEPLLALPSSVPLPTLSAYQDGRLLAQDKASCMPAWVLLAPLLADAEEGKLPWHGEQGEEEEAAGAKGKKRSLRVLDATAAPGNKTTMAAALVAQVEELNGKVVACERDLGRFKVMKDMLKRADAKNVTPMNVDFLSLKTDDPKLKNVSHILVDPSCSGSGIPSRLDHLIPSAPEAEQLQRIKALSNFQLAIVSHALRFSGVKRVVYSTCSVWEQEDEGVVMRVLAKKEFQEAGWRLAPREEVLPGWERRGRVAACGGDELTTTITITDSHSDPGLLSPYDVLRTAIADSLVRCLPEDGTNGFFVACFVKDESLPPICVTLPVVTAPTPEDVTIADVDVDVEAPAAGAGAGAGKSGKKDKKTKSSGNQAARRAKAETLGTLGISSTATPTTTVTEKKKAAPTPKAMAIVEANEEDWEDEPAAVEKKEETGKKLSKKQMYLLKKEEVKRKKAAAAGGK